MLIWTYFVRSSLLRGKEKIAGGGDHRFPITWEDWSGDVIGIGEGLTLHLGGTSLTAVLGTSSDFDFGHHWWALVFGSWDRKDLALLTGGTSDYLRWTWSLSSHRGRDSRRIFASRTTAAAPAGAARAQKLGLRVWHSPHRN